MPDVTPETVIEAAKLKWKDADYITFQENHAVVITPTRMEVTKAALLYVTKNLGFFTSETLFEFSAPDLPSLLAAIEKGK